MALRNLASKAIGSISTGWSPASSGIGGTFSLNVGSFGSLNIGAGISGTSAFASANVSILGLPIAGVGKSVGALGKISDPFASTLVGNFSDAISTNLLRGTGTTDVGSFLQSVGKDTANGFVQGQYAQTGIPTAIGVATQTRQFATDAYGAFRDVFAPPVPVQYGASIEYNSSELTSVSGHDIDLAPFPSNVETSFSEYEGLSNAGYYYFGGTNPEYIGLVDGRELNGYRFVGNGHHYASIKEAIEPNIAYFSKEAMQYLDSDDARVLQPKGTGHGRTWHGKSGYSGAVAELTEVRLEQWRVANELPPGAMIPDSQQLQFVQDLVEGPYGIKNQPVDTMLSRFNTAVSDGGNAAVRLARDAYKTEIGPKRRWVAGRNRAGFADFGPLIEAGEGTSQAAVRSLRNLNHRLKIESNVIKGNVGLSLVLGGVQMQTMGTDVTNESVIANDMANYILNPGAILFDFASNGDAAFNNGMNSYAASANDSHWEYVNAYNSMQFSRGLYTTDMERERRFHIEAILSHEFIFGGPNVPAHMREDFIQDMSGAGLRGSMEPLRVYNRYIANEK